MFAHGKRENRITAPALFVYIQLVWLLSEIADIYMDIKFNVCNCSVNRKGNDLSGHDKDNSTGSSNGVGLGMGGERRMAGVADATPSLLLPHQHFV